MFLSELFPRFFKDTKKFSDFHRGIQAEKEPISDASCRIGGDEMEKKPEERSKLRIFTFQTKTDLRQRLERVYAGVRRDRDGSPVPRGVGRLCRWAAPRPFATFADYR